MFYAFVGVVVGIGEPWFEIWRDFAYFKSVVLGGDNASVGAFDSTGLVLASVAVFEFVCVSACGEREDLMSEANTERWNFVVKGFFYCGDCGICHFGVAGAVGDDKGVEVWKFVFKDVCVPRDDDNIHASFG